MGSKLGLWWVLAGVILTAQAKAQTTTSALKLDSPSGRAYDLKGDWKLDIGGGNAQEGKDTWSGAYIYFNSNFNFRLMDSLSAKISPVARVYGGRSQERYDDDGSNSYVGLTDGFISFHPLTWMEFKGGVLSQRVLGNSILVSGWKAFPGAQEIFQVKGGEFEAGLVFQQVIPSSHSMNTEREKQEALPWLRTEHLELSGRHFRKWLTWNAKGGHFAWSDIPSKVVYESVRTGNAPLVTPTPAGSKFAYGHEGLFGGGEICMCGPVPVNFTVEYKRIYNTMAPGDSADAQMWGLGPSFKWQSYELDLRYRSYFTESDATIAAYSKSRYGGTNRIGDNLEASLHFGKQRFAIYAEAFLSRPINTADVQQRKMEQYYLGVETDYADF